MPRPLVLIHGYSDNGQAFFPLCDALRLRHVDPPIDINICSYISLNNEITIKDIAEGLDRAFRLHPLLKDDAQEFDAIVHSTGMLVIRAWLTNYAMPAATNTRLKRLKHLVGLAPATWGSPQAHKGRTWLGALVKGNRQLGPDFLNAGDLVLDGLELGSRLTWDLAHVDLLGPAPYYDKGSETPFMAVFVGNQPYEGLSSVANEPGTDGTVRWAGCGLNTRKVRIDLTRTPMDAHGAPATDRLSISPWAENRLGIPMIPVNGKNHATLVADPDSGMVDLVASFLKVGDGDSAETYDGWMARAAEYGKASLPRMLTNPGQSAAGVPEELRNMFGHLFGDPGTPLEGWQQFVVRAVDERGDGVSDYVLDILRKEGNGVQVSWVPFTEMYTDVHTYAADRSFRCFHIRLPQGISSGKVPLRVRINASTGTELLTYQAYGMNDSQLNETGEPVELDITRLPSGNGTLFYPFTTTLIEIILNREPLPLGKESRLLSFVDTK